MKIELYEIPVHTLAEFAEAYNLTMQIHERNKLVMGEKWSDESRYYAQFKNCEVTTGHMLLSEYGNGATHDLAMQDYAKQISGKRLVLNALTVNRKEIAVPKLTHIPQEKHCEVTP